MTVGVVDVASSSTVDVLRHLHCSLDSHFRELHQARETLEPTAPVFALEHDLAPGDLELLSSTVRAAVRQGLDGRHRRWWLPFVVYAAESGYAYVGDEYWPTFESATPGWRDDYRALVKMWFSEFAAAYGGARPVGAFATTFRIIAWPITHAVLPTYLQRQLAQLLFEFSGGLTSDLLDDPEVLGQRLARRASAYTERFRIFCQNTVLLGQVATALLAEHDEESPYLVSSTLERLVQDISREQRARHWLNSARQSAKRARTKGFLGPGRHAITSTTNRPRRATDPRLFLRRDDSWSAYAELPDLSAIEGDFPRVYEQLRSHRARVSGARKTVPRSGLLYGAQEVQFGTWPRPDQPFVQVDGGDDAVNRTLAAQCIVTTGPWWLFRRQGSALAVEIKSKFVRPGQRYILVGEEHLNPPAVSWAASVPLSVSGVSAYQLDVPDHLAETEESELLAAGIPVVSSVAIRPVGIVASAWDGEGEVEWLAGEPAIIGIRSDLAPKRCRMLVGQQVYFLTWPKSQSDLLIALDGVAVGTHEVRVALLGDGDRQIAEGSLVVTIRDPQVRPEAAAAGEGIRLLAAPARPTMAELWDQRASVSIDGPAGVEAEITIELFSSAETPLGRFRRTVHLPVDEAAWSGLAKSIRAEHVFKHAYDEAESCRIAVSRAGVGFANLTVERGFRALRWRFTRDHDRRVVATLVDRTDGSETSVEFFAVESPLVPVEKVPDECFTVPPRGGLVIARTGDVAASVILPTDPNQLLHLPDVHPIVEATSRNSREVLRLVRAHQQWTVADLPADAFAEHQALAVREAIARAIATVISGAYWAQVEWAIDHDRDVADHLDDMQRAVGVSRSHRDLATHIAHSLYDWLTPEKLISGFAGVIEPTLRTIGVPKHLAVAEFLLALAGHPGYIAEWDEAEAIFLLDRVIQSPVLFRAARFAVLGTRAINEVDGMERGS